MNTSTLEFANAAKSYQRQHNEAVKRPRSKHEQAIVALVRALESYAIAHLDMYRGPIGTSDYVLAPYFASVAWGVIKLLDGELGRLDGGQVWHHIWELCKAHGVELES